MLRARLAFDEDALARDDDGTLAAPQLAATACGILERRERHEAKGKAGEILVFGRRGDLERDYGLGVGARLVPNLVIVASVVVDLDKGTGRSGCIGAAQNDVRARGARGLDRTATVPADVLGRVHFARAKKHFHVGACLDGSLYKGTRKSA